MRYQCRASCLGQMHHHAERCTTFFSVMRNEAQRSEASMLDSSLVFAMTGVGRVSDCGIKPLVSLRGRKATEAIQTRDAVPKMDSSLWLAMTRRECSEGQKECLL
jgi:hypothetical protein